MSLGQASHSPAEESEAEGRRAGASSSCWLAPLQLEAAALGGKEGALSVSVQ